jgi:hypothetical protein
LTSHADAYHFLYGFVHAEGLWRQPPAQSGSVGVGIISFCSSPVSSKTVSSYPLVLALLVFVVLLSVQKQCLVSSSSMLPFLVLFSLQLEYLYIGVDAYSILVVAVY